MKFLRISKLNSFLFFVMSFLNSINICTGIDIFGYSFLPIRLLRRYEIELNSKSTKSGLFSRSSEQVGTVNCTRNLNHGSESLAKPEDICREVRATQNCLSTREKSSLKSTYVRAYAPVLYACHNTRDLMGNMKCMEDPQRICAPKCEPQRQGKFFYLKDVCQHVACYLSCIGDKLSSHCDATQTVQFLRDLIQITSRSLPIVLQYIKSDGHWPLVCKDMARGHFPDMRKPTFSERPLNIEQMNAASQKTTAIPRNSTIYDVVNLTKNISIEEDTKGQRSESVHEKKQPQLNDSVRKYAFVQDKAELSHEFMRTVLLGLIPASLIVVLLIIVIKALY